MALTESYQKLVAQVQAIVDGEPDLVANTANVSALLYEHLNITKNNSVNWAGFYFVKNDQLVLGPFQGKVACVRINFGKGVCGTAAQTRKSVVVPDVHKFPGHIACDSASNSEIVVPIIKDDKLYGVIDVDSVKLNTFDDNDRIGLEAVAAIVANLCEEYEKNPNKAPTRKGH